MTAPRPDGEEGTKWFDELYRDAAGDPQQIPWADLEPNPYLRTWLDAHTPEPARAVVVGCGLGDDAEELARRGWEVTAFDISATAVRWARYRSAGSPVRYVQADVLRPPREWHRAFDLVVEAYTLQSLPEALRPVAAHGVAGLVAAGGTAVVIARGAERRITDGPPWPLIEEDLRPLEEVGLERVIRTVDRESGLGSVRRWTLTYRRPA